MPRKARTFQYRSRLSLEQLEDRVTPASIYVIDSGVSSHGMVQAAENNLAALGNTVTTGGTLASYSGYDQLWDLRYTGNLTAADITAMGAFLQSGHSLFLTGEHSGFDSSRNISLVSWITSSACIRRAGP